MPSPRAMRSARAFGLPFLAVALLGACTPAPTSATQAGPPSAAGQAAPISIPIPSAAPANADAGPQVLADGGTDDAAAAVAASPPWPDAASCSFPPAAPPEGVTAKQCCHPSPTVSVCLATTSQIHNHVVGPYTEKVLTVSRASTDEPFRSFPLDRQSHGSMSRPDEVMARLSFRVLPTGLELRVRAGCQNICRKERCSEEETRIARICASAGEHVWEGDGLGRK